MQLVSGEALVLAARVPKAGDRWRQVHFNRAVADIFFRLQVGGSVGVKLQRVDQHGSILSEVERHLVYSATNKNCKIEMEFDGEQNYPTDGPPIALIVELKTRSFRYLSLRPADPGYLEMNAMIASEEPLGLGTRRVAVVLDDIEVRYPPIAAALRGRTHL